MIDQAPILDGNMLARILPPQIWMQPMIGIDLLVHCLIGF